MDKIKKYIEYITAFGFFISLVIVPVILDMYHSEFLCCTLICNVLAIIILFLVFMIILRECKMNIRLLSRLGISVWIVLTGELTFLSIAYMDTHSRLIILVYVSSLMMIATIILATSLDYLNGEQELTVKELFYLIYLFAFIVLSIFNYMVRKEIPTQFIKLEFETLATAVIAIEINWGKILQIPELEEAFK